MSMLPSRLFGRRNEPQPPRNNQIWDPPQDSGWGSTRNRTTPNQMGFPIRETSPVLLNANIEWKETPEAHVYKAHLPGLKRNDVRVEVDDGRVLCITGEKSIERQEQRGGWHRVELSSGHFVQRFTLPENAMVDQVKAHIDNGVLTITVPKHKNVNRNVRNIKISEH